MSALVSLMQADRTVLHYAAELGFHDAAKLLLEKQADANAVDKVGYCKILFPLNLCLATPGLLCWVLRLCKHVQMDG